MIEKSFRNVGRSFIEKEREEKLAEREECRREKKGAADPTTMRHSDERISSSLFLATLSNASSTERLQLKTRFDAFIGQSLDPDPL